MELWITARKRNKGEMRLALWIVRVLSLSATHVHNTCLCEALDAPFTHPHLRNYPPCTHARRRSCKCARYCYQAITTSNHHAESSTCGHFRLGKPAPSTQQQPWALQKPNNFCITYACVCARSTSWPPNRCNGELARISRGGWTIIEISPKINIDSTRLFRL